jgi:hypothetical protein
MDERCTHRAMPAASRPSLRLTVLQPSVVGRRPIRRSGAGRSQLPSPSGLHGSVVTSLHNNTVQFVRPLLTDVRIRADLSRALSLALAWAATRCPSVATCLLPSWHVREWMVDRLAVPVLAHTVRSNSHSSSAQQLTWVRGWSMARSEKPPDGVCAPWPGEVPSRPEWCSRATSWRHPGRPTHTGRSKRSSRPRDHG